VDVLDIEELLDIVGEADAVRVAIGVADTVDDGARVFVSCAEFDNVPDPVVVLDTEVLLLIVLDTSGVADSLVLLDCVDEPVADKDLRGEDEPVADTV